MMPGGNEGASHLLEQPITDAPDDDEIVQAHIRAYAERTGTDPDDLLAALFAPLGQARSRWSA